MIYLICLFMFLIFMDGWKWCCSVCVYVFGVIDFCLWFVLWRFLCECFWFIFDDYLNICIFVNYLLIECNIDWKWFLLILFLKIFYVIIFNIFLYLLLFFIVVIYFFLLFVLFFRFLSYIINGYLYSFKGD